MGFKRDEDIKYSDAISAQKKIKNVCITSEICGLFFWCIVSKVAITDYKIILCCNFAVMFHVSYFSRDFLAIMAL